MKGSPSDDSRLDRVQSLARALGILDVLGEQPDGLNLTQISGIVGLPRSTSHRLLSTLNSLAYVEFEAATNRWLLGRQAFRLGRAFLPSRDLGRLLRPTLRSLMLDSSETVSFSVAREDGVESIHQSRPTHSQTALSRSGVARLPFHASAAGKAILAHREEVVAAEFCDAGRAISLTRNTIVVRQMLFAELGRVREMGYAVDDQEHRQGVCCVAAPVFDSTGRVRGALSISASLARMPQARIPVLARTLTRAAQRLSDATGDLIAA